MEIPISEQLVETAERRYRPVTVSEEYLKTRRDATLHDVVFSAGQQDVVRWLRDVYEAQKKRGRGV